MEKKDISLWRSFFESKKNVFRDNGLNVKKTFSNKWKYVLCFVNCILFQCANNTTKKLVNYFAEI